MVTWLRKPVATFPDVMTGELTSFDQDSTAAQNERLTFALEAAGVGTWDYNLLTGQAQWSGICKELFGLPTNAEVTAPILLAQVHPDDRSWVDQANRQALDPSGDGQHHIVFRTVSSAGVLRWVEAKGKTIRDAQNQIVRFSGIVQDVTQGVTAKQQLDQVQRQVLASFEQAPVGIAAIVNPELTFWMANPFYGGLVGRNVDELVGKPLLEALPELAGQGFDSLLRKVLTTGLAYVANEVPVTLMRGGELETIYIDMNYQPMGQVDDHGMGVLVVAVDVTQQVLARQKIEKSEARYRTLSTELERQVQQRTQELETSVSDLRRSNDNLQQFAYVASHDLQEPLRKIQAFGDLLGRHYTDSAEAADYLQRMQTAASRMSTLIRDLLAFSRIATQQNTSASVPLTSLVQLVLTDLEVLIQENEAILKVDSLPTVLGDASQLGQLFQNLLSNALKFRHPDVAPVVRIGFQLIADTALPTGIRPTRQAAAYYRLDVIDNGIGFDQKYADRIFQVFQRLHGKSQYAGTGIGLAICEKVVANHGGAITASSTPGQGATFSVYLPAKIG